MGVINASRCSLFPLLFFFFFPSGEYSILSVDSPRMSLLYNNLADVHAEHILTPSDNRTRGNAAYRTLYTNADVHCYLEIIDVTTPGSLS
jgi:hypothetical protein